MPSDTVLARIGSVVFVRAGQDDEPEVRRLLRETPVGGRYQVTLEREPDAFRSGFGLARAHDFVLARDEAAAQYIGVCERIVHDAFIDGAPRRLAYLGALRVAASHRNRIGLLRGGFAAIRTLSRDDYATPYALTSIATDNSPALRILTAGIAGLPRYHALGDYVTLFLRTRATSREAISMVSAMRPGEEAEVASFLQKSLRRYQFATCWTAADIEALADRGLPPGNILIARRGAAIVGTIAVWDQRAVRQAVVRRYPAAIAWTRPILDLAARLIDAPTLPPPGQPIPMAALSHLALAEEDDAETLLVLLAAALDLARGQGLPTVMIGFGAESQWRRIIARRYRALAYDTRLFLVHWPEDGADIAALTRRPPNVDVALL